MIHGQWNGGEYVGRIPSRSRNMLLVNKRLGLYPYLNWIRKLTESVGPSQKRKFRREIGHAEFESGRQRKNDQ